MVVGGHGRTTEVLRGEGQGGCLVWGGLTTLLFLPGVDDAESECGLDNFGNFDWVIENHGDEQSLEDQLENLLEFIRATL